MSTQQVNEQDLAYRLHKRAEIRRQISTRKSVQEDKPDRLADLLDEAADEIKKIQLMLEEEMLNPQCGTCNVRYYDHYEENDNHKWIP